METQLVEIEGRIYEWADMKAVSLDEKGRQVREAWYARFQPKRDMMPAMPSGEGWVKEIFDDAIIIETSEGLFSYPYTEGDDGLEFGEPTKVEIEYRPVSQKSALKAQSEREKLRKAREARAKRYNIAAKEGGALAPPKGYPAGDSDYGDPVNYRYPIDPSRLLPARQYFNHDGQREAGGYTSAEWAVIGKRIAARSGEEYSYKGGKIERKEKKKKTVGPNMLKAISKDDNTMRVANYLALWDVRDLEGIASEKVNPDGSHGEYFTSETSFESAYTKTGRLYVDWEHGLSGRWYAEDGDDIPAPGRDDVLGYVDWGTVKADENGLWVERVLNRRNQYMKFLEVLLDAGLIGTSSEAPNKSVEKAADGRIVKWPLRRDTMTVSPMEWRMMKENPLLVKAVKGLLELPEELPAADDDGGDGAGALCQDGLEVARARAEIDILLTEIDMEV